MALLTKQTIGLPGLNPATFAAAAGGGDTVAVDRPGIYLEVVNGDASSKTVTIADPRTPYGQTQPGIAHVVTAGTRAKIALPQELANSSGIVSITYSAVTSVTVGAFTR